MTELLLIFLGSAYLNNLLLMALVDREADTPRQSVDAVLLCNGLLLLIAGCLDPIAQRAGWTPAPQARVFLLAMAFTSTLLSLGRGMDSGVTLRSQPHLRGLRLVLPLLVANLATLTVGLLDTRSAHALLEVLGLCFGATVACCVALALLAPLRERVKFASVPRLLRGAPIAILSTAICALALTGALGSLPW